MTYEVLLLAAVLVVGLASLLVSVRALRSSRRSEEYGADRYELLRDQQDRLELLREERKMLREELEQESKEKKAKWVVVRRGSSRC